MLSLIGSLNSNSAMHFYVSISLSNKSMHPVNVNVNTNLFSALRSETWGTGIRGLMRGMTTLPEGNQELLVVRDKVWRPPGELGVSKSMKCDIFPSVLRHCWLGDRKGIQPVKKLDVGLLVMIWLKLCTTCSSSSPVVTTTSIRLSVWSSGRVCDR